MSEDISQRLRNAIEKFESGSYNENDLHSTIESVISSITEFHLNDLRIFLMDKEGDLEKVDFMVNKENRRSEYLKIISQVKNFLDQRIIDAGDGNVSK